MSRSELRPPAAAPSRPIGAAGRAVLWLLAFAPAGVCAVLVAQHAVDVPLGGDWARADLLEAGPAAGAGSGLRGAIPRLVASANLHGFGNDLRLEMALAWALVVVSALCVHGLLRRTLGGGAAVLYGSSFLANLLLFSPLQWENFLWAERALHFVPTAALSAALLVLWSRASRGLAFTACALLAGLASLSAPQGLVVWGVVLAAVALRGETGTARRRRIFLIAWLALAAAMAGVQWMGNGVSGDVGAAAPDVLRFCASLLGSAFSRTTLLPPGELAPGLGAALTLLFVACAAVHPSRWRDAAFRARRLPWLCFGAYALLLALLAALRPGAAAPGEALLPRHAGVSLYLCVATLPLAILALGELRDRVAATRPGLHAALEWAPAFGAGALLVAVGLGWLAGVQGMAEWKSARLQARTSLVFLDRFEPRHPERLGVSPAELHRAVGIFDAHGYLERFRARGDGIEPYTAGDPLPRDSGRVESAWSDAGRVVLDGFAWLSGPDRRADGVLLTARSGDGPRRVVGLAELTGLPLPPIPEHDHIYNDARIPGIDELAAWSVEIPAEALPQAPRVLVEAFAVDSDAMRLRRLAAPVAVRRTPDGLRAELQGGDAP